MADRTVWVCLLAALTLAGCADDKPKYLEPCKNHDGVQRIDQGWLEGDTYICKDGTVMKEPPE